MTLRRIRNDARRSTVLFWASTILFGCTRGGLPTVSGTITMDGEPLSNAFIEFVPTSVAGGTSSYGKTDENGRYEMAFTNNRRGVMIGEYRVTIRTSDVVVSNNGKVSMTTERVPDRYRGSRSELVRSVVEGKNLFDFSLKGEGRVLQPRLIE